MDTGNQLPLLPSFPPPMCLVHVMVQVLHLLERVIHTQTTLFPAEVRPFAIWVLLAHPSMFPNALLDSISLVTVREEEGFIRLWSPCTMCHLLVLLQDGLASIGLLADITFMPLSLLTGLLMLSQHLPGGQRLMTLAAWIPSTLVHIHVPPHPMHYFENLVTNRVLLLIPAHSGQGVRNSLTWSTCSSWS